MKYDFEMEVDESTSVGKIVAQIKENSRVLEFGPGNGRMTKYLMEEKNCYVAIVELDKELYDHVSEFSNDGFYGNIDEEAWTKHFEGQTFDYIIFADVLEHLMNPKNALMKVKPFLSAEGQILITFPNIAHNSVLIDLFNNKLDWRETGLLDATHKSFFVQSGFEKLFEEIGLFIAKEDFTLNEVGYNELESTYEDLPVEVRAAFKARPFGEVYQYFYALCAEAVEHPIRTIPENSSYRKNIHFLYDCGEEDQKEFDVQLNNVTGENKTFTIDIPENIKLLKIFPSLTGAVVDLVLTVAGTIIQPSATNAIYNKEAQYFFSDNQVPVIEIDDKQIAGKTMTITVNYKYEGNFSDTVHGLIDYVLEQQTGNNSSKNTELMVSEKQMTKYKKVSISKFDSLVSLNIDDIVRHVEEKKTVIRGWAYSKEDKLPIDFKVSAEMAVEYSVTREYRRDVIDMFELKGDQEYGFVIEVIDPEDQPMYTLNVSADNGRKLQYRLEKPNMVQPGNKIQRAMRSMQTRGLIGSMKWYFKRQEQQEIPVDPSAILEEIKTFKFQPKISVAVPVYNVEEKWLDACVSSLQNQYYENWELCLADDASPSDYIKPLLKKYADADDRIKVIYREENGHISEATNSALTIATGDYVGFMDNDDELAPQALYEVVKVLNEDQTIDFIYTDEDKVTESGKRFNAFYKSKWNSELILNHNYITHFVVVKRSLLEKTGGLKTEFNGAQDYDFVLRATENAENITHIPGMMYHWRAIESSTALNPESKGYAYVAGQRAVQAAMDRRNIKANVEIAEFYGSYKINYIYDTIPKVSIVITNDTADINDYLKKLLEKTIYENYEIVLPNQMKENVHSTSNKLVYSDGQTRDELINASTGDYIMLLDAGLVPTKSNWLTEMMNMAQQAQAGIVTGRVVDQRYRIENIGISVDAEKNRLLYPEQGTPGKSLGYYYRIALPRNVQAVTEACMIFRKADYLAVSGITEELGKDVMGVDLSLKFAKQLDKTIIYCSYAIFKAEEKMQNLDKKPNIKALTDKWSEQDLVDKYKNPKHL
ncbi:glycosyl transferase family 2 [Enterococcus silesiacus]|uniref:Glycosyl transferase family 2 n=2 Tax=Enterococcus silesiacus TaxID=332949 RepID=A0ABN4JB72_9ENTE|nr:glycosyltransferase [Enterococcus silesiacus]ALS03196.1 glycosyl transferase family 2 [Enterococcus silesiacus]